MCNEYADGYINYPNCTQCTTAIHCSDKATNVTSNANKDVCECTCSPGFMGPTCNQCASGYLNYPNCTKYSEAIHTVAQVTTLVSAIMVTPASIDSLQSSALFGGLYCVRPSIKNMSQDVSWTLSPLAAVAFQAGPQPVHLTVWNLILASFLSATHYGLTKGISMAWKEEHRARVKLRYPSMSFTIVVFLYQGMTFGAYKLLMLGYFSYFAIGIVTLLVVSFGLPLYVWHWNRANATSLTWISGDALPNRFVPRGIWGPDDVIYQYSVFFYDFRETQRMFKVKQLLFSHAIALTTSIETHSVGACHAQIGVCIALIAGMIFLYAKDRPMRWPILNYTRILILLTQVGQLFMIFFAAEVIAEETVSMMSAIFCLLDGLAAWICFAREWQLWDLLRGDASPDSNSSNKSWWKFWSEEDSHLLLENLNDSVDHSTDMLPIEMTPRVSCSSPRSTFAQEMGTANIDPGASLPHVEMMPGLSYSPPQLAPEAASPTFCSPMLEDTPLDSTYGEYMAYLKEKGEKLQPVARPDLPALRSQPPPRPHTSEEHPRKRTVHEAQSSMRLPQRPGKRQEELKGDPDDLKSEEDARERTVHEAQSSMRLPQRPEKRQEGVKVDLDDL